MHPWNVRGRFVCVFLLLFCFSFSFPLVFWSSVLMELSMTWLFVDCCKHSRMSGDTMTFYYILMIMTLLQQFTWDFSRSFTHSACCWLLCYVIELKERKRRMRRRKNMVNWRMWIKSSHHLRMQWSMTCVEPPNVNLLSTLAEMRKRTTAPCLVIFEFVCKPHYKTHLYNLISEKERIAKKVRGSEPNNNWVEEEQKSLLWFPIRRVGLCLQHSNASMRISICIGWGVHFEFKIVRQMT